MGRFPYATGRRLALDRGGRRSLILRRHPIGGSLAGIGLWLLVVDLVFQGWGLIAFGLAFKARASWHSSQPAAV
jgi:hypothetical protein